MLRRLWPGKRGGGPAVVEARAESGAPAPAPPTPVGSVERAFWLILWRSPSAGELRDAVRALEAGQTADELHRRLVASTELGLLRAAVLEDRETGRNEREANLALAALGGETAFVEAAFEALLGRQADPSGGAFYAGELRSGRPRLWLLSALLRSDEFESRYRTLCPQAGFVPRDVQLCELANPAKWGNPDWMALLASLSAVPTDLLSMHRKGYEFGQLLFCLTQLGLAGEEAEILSVGAGHEPVLYWLANRVRRVVATDMYGGVWQEEGSQEGDAVVLHDAARFAPFPYRADRLVFMQMDGRLLAFRDATFDAVYSLSSIEHFGGFEGARASVDDMARVLKPGGALILATEYCLSGPPHHEAFQPAEVHALVEHPALSLVQPIDERVWDRYTAVPIDLRVNPHQTPHMLVTDSGTVFTSVFVCLRKRA
jgi:SAM-dependent methyltransferase